MKAPNLFLGLMRYILSINQNLFDAIQHGDVLKRLFMLSLQNECFKL